MKRFGQICHAKNLHTAVANYCTIFKQTIKSIRPNSFAIEKTCFSTKGHRIGFGTRLPGGSAGPFNLVPKAEV
jgi:hypothetical protein